MTENKTDIQTAIDNLNRETARANLRHAQRCPACGYPDEKITITGSDDQSLTTDTQEKK